MVITMLGIIEHTYKNMECQGDQSIDLDARQFAAPMVVLTSTIYQ